MNSFKIKKKMILSMKIVVAQLIALNKNALVMDVKEIAQPALNH